MTFDQSVQSAEGILSNYSLFPFGGEGQGEWVLVQCAALERFELARAPTHPSPLRGADLSPEGEEVKLAQNSLPAGNFQGIPAVERTGCAKRRFVE